ncbi:glycosyltransferase [bacterium]|nr:glycosyltransferase [bacterium]
MLYTDGSHEISRLPCEIKSQYKLKAFLSISSDSKTLNIFGIEFRPLFVDRFISLITRFCTILFKKLSILLTRSSASEVKLSQTFPCPQGKKAENIIKSSNADIVIIEYLRLHPFNSLVRSSLPKAKILLDAHDVLSDRCRAFTHFGYPHWCYVTQSEESFLLRAYDAIVAINYRDSKLFSRLSPFTPILVAGHPASNLISNHTDSKALSVLHARKASKILFLAGGGYANLDALEILLCEILPHLSLMSQSSYELIVAGSICRNPNAQDLIHNATTLYPVTCLGLVDSLSELYESVDIACNPVRFGGGLKIKNIEALSSGLALVTSTEGSHGLPITDPQSFYVADHSEDHARHLVKLIDNPQLLSLMKQRALASANQFLNPDQVYKPLCDFIDGISVGEGNSGHSV